MFIIFLRLVDRSRLSQWMEGHKVWIRQGFDEGVFILVGSLSAGAGGVILAHNASRAEIEARVQSDPFVAEGIAQSEILDVTPGQMDERLAFLRPLP